MNAERWTVLLDGPRAGWHNMAIDSALLELADAEGVAVLRLYRWEPHCLSFGRHEPASRRYDRAKIERLALDCVRRPTGGRAVWHAGELTYAVAAPLGALGGGGMREAYRVIHELLADALRDLGASPELAPLTPDPRSLSPHSGPCFNAPAGGEVMIAGRKVIGSAQLRRGDAVLQHGSLLLEDDQSLLRSLATPAAAAEPNQSEAPLSSLLARRISFEEAASAITRAAEAAFGPFAGPNGMASRIAPRVRAHAGLFQDPAWTWQR